MTGSMPPDSKVSVGSFARQSNGQMIPLSKSLSYFSVIPLEDTDLQRLVYDPASTIPPRIASFLPKLRIVVVAYLERTGPGDDAETHVTFRRPPQARRIFSDSVQVGDETFIFLAAKDEDVADYHDTLYQEIAFLLVDSAREEVVERFCELVREELKTAVHGEIDDPSWRLKEKLLSKQTDPLRKTKLMRSYCEQALADTLTLYLHGLCCDIDVEAGPRQLPSGRIRKRLELLRSLLPPPKGVAVFPEELPQAPA